MATVQSIEELERKARRLRRRDGARKAALVWERLCLEIPESARHWALLGDCLLEARRPEEAVRAMRQSVWLRMRSGDLRRAAAMARLLLRHVAADPTAERAIERFAQAA